jgi:hypothetical protein
MVLFLEEIKDRECYKKGSKRKGNASTSQEVDPKRRKIGHSTLNQYANAIVSLWNDQHAMSTGPDNSHPGPAPTRPKRVSEILKLKQIEDMKEEQANLVDRGKNTMIDMVTPASVGSVVYGFWKDDNEVAFEV